MPSIAGMRVPGNSERKILTTVLSASKPCMHNDVKKRSFRNVFDCAGRGLCHICDDGETSSRRTMDAGRKKSRAKSHFMGMNERRGTIEAKRGGLRWGFRSALAAKPSAASSTSNGGNHFIRARRRTLNDDTFPKELPSCGLARNCRLASALVAGEARVPASHACARAFSLRARNIAWRPPILSPHLPVRRVESSCPGTGAAPLAAWSSWRRQIPLLRSLPRRGIGPSGQMRERSSGKSLRSPRHARAPQSPALATPSAREAPAGWLVPPIALPG